MRVGIHEAKSKLSKLITAVQSGEEVIITSAGRPVARLIPCREEGWVRPLGLFRGQVIIQLLEPSSEEIVKDFWGGG